MLKPVSASSVVMASGWPLLFKRMIFWHDILQDSQRKHSYSGESWLNTPELMLVEVVSPSDAIMDGPQSDQKNC